MRLHEVGDRLIYDELLSSIGTGCRHYDLCGKELAAKASIPERTYRERVQHPETFRLGEICAIARQIGVKVRFTVEVEDVY